MHRKDTEHYKQKAVIKLNIYIHKNISEVFFGYLLYSVIFYLFCIKIVTIIIVTVRNNNLKKGMDD